MSAFLNDLSFDFAELIALKKLALQLVDEANFYKTSTERNEATVRQLLKEKLELQLHLDTVLETKTSIKINSDRPSDHETVVLLKDIAVLEESSMQAKATVQQLQAHVQAMKRDLKNSELQRFQLEAQLGDAKSRLEMELNCRKEITEQVSTASRVLHELKNAQSKLANTIIQNEKEVAEACSIYRQLSVRNKFLESALAKSEETLTLVRKRSLPVSLSIEDESFSKTAKLIPSFSQKRMEERLNIVEGRCAKLQQELQLERKKSSELLESLTTASALNEQLTLAKEAAESDLKTLKGATNVETLKSD